MRGDAHLRGIAGPENLVQAVRHENHFVRRHIVEETIVIRSHRIAVPMHQKDFGSRKTKKLVQVQQLSSCANRLVGSLILQRGEQIRDVRSIVGSSPESTLRVFGNIAARSAVVEVPLGGREMLFEEAFSPALHQDK